jgi:hypothetical protein
VEAGAVESAVCHSDDCTHNTQHAQESWRDAISTLANLSQAEEDHIHKLVVTDGGAQALVKHMHTAAREDCARGLAALSKYFAYHPLLLSTALLSKAITVLTDEASSEASILPCNLTLTLTLAP